jgi:predicted nuclease of restriction endonuclease-like (RecB) superfamily
MIENTRRVDFLFDYKYFLQNILTKIQSTRYQMLMSVSKQTLMLYWDIGRAVSEKTQTNAYGKAIVEQLSKDLQAEFPGIRGFSSRNIWRMKMFYEFYAKFGICATAMAQIPNSQDSATAVAELQSIDYKSITSIGWVQNCVILEKRKSLEQVAFYLKQTKEKGWSKLDLLEKIEHNCFENHALAQNNFEATVSESLKAQVAWEFLDDYNIELINPDQPVLEKALENAIIENLVKFLHEMGGTFTFVGRQFRLTLDGKEYFVDLLFFNLTLNCYVVFELLCCAQHNNSYVA